MTRRGLFKLLGFGGVAASVGVPEARPMPTLDRQRSVEMALAELEALNEQINARVIDHLVQRGVLRT